MKFLLEFFTCCGSRQPGSSRSVKGKRLLVASKPRRSMSRKPEEVIDDGGDYGAHHEWKPSLVSISEDDIFTEVSRDDIGLPKAERGRLRIQASPSSGRGSGSSPNSHVRRGHGSTLVRPPPLVSSRSFMF